MFYKSDFKVLQKINDGPFWDTYVVETNGLNNEINVHFELRVISKTNCIRLREEKRVVYEIQRRKSICNPYISTIISYFQDYGNCYLFSQLGSGGYLYYYLRKRNYFTLDIARFFIVEIIIAIQYLHKKKLLYRFLCPENIMITAKGHVLLKFDFENSLGMTETQYKENIKHIPYDYIQYKRMSPSSDYWSIGIVLYELIYGVHPFESRSYQEELNNLHNQKIVFPFQTLPEVEDLLIRLLDRYDFRRLGYHKTDKSIIRKHNFFSGINWEAFEDMAVDSPFYLVDFAFLERKGVNMAYMFPNDMKKGQVDGYGELFSIYNPGDRQKKIRDI